MPGLDDSMFHGVKSSEIQRMKKFFSPCHIPLQNSVLVSDGVALNYILKRE